MINRLIINDIDIFANYGIFVVEDGYDELVQYPALKKISSNNWAEEDGIEPDLSTPVLDAREITLDFAIVDKSYSTIKSFINFLTENVYNIFNFKDIGYKFTLRLSSQSSLLMYDKLGFFSLKFSDDFPLLDYSYLEPKLHCDSQEVAVSYNYIDDGETVTVKNDLSYYGVTLVDDSFNSLNEIPDVKERLLRDMSASSGVIYDSTSKVCFDSRKLSLSCLMTLCDKSDFWRNYNALLYDLTRPNGNIVYYNNNELSCYYYSSTMNEFISDDKGVWCEFTINLVVYNY